MGSRFYEAEFPLVRLIVYRFLLLTRSGNTTGSPATDCAPKKIGALRSNNNWVKPEDQYGILFIGEKRPATTRRLPQKERQSLPPPERALARTGEKIVLAENHGAFHRRRQTGPREACSARPEQWFGALAHVA